MTLSNGEDVDARRSITKLKSRFDAEPWIAEMSEKMEPLAAQVEELQGCKELLKGSLDEMWQQVKQMSDDFADVRTMQTNILRRLAKTPAETEAASKAQAAAEPVEVDKLTESILATVEMRLTSMTKKKDQQQELLQAQVDASRKELHTLQQQAQADRASKEKAVDALKEQLSAVELALTQSRDSALQRVKEDYEEQLARLNKELANFKKELPRIESDSAILTRKMVQEVQAQVQELCCRLREELEREALARKTAQETTVKDMESLMEELEEKVRAMQSDMKDFKMFCSKEQQAGRGESPAQTQGDPAAMQGAPDEASVSCTGVRRGALLKGIVFQHPSDPAVKELTLALEGRILTERGEMSSEQDKEKFLKQLLLKTHPDKHPDKPEAYTGAFQWLTEWQETHGEWFLTTSSNK